LLWCVAAGAGVVAVADADAPLRAALSAALEANERLREELARRDAEIERLSAELAVLQRMVFGRSSERARPQDLAPDGDGGGDPGRDREGGGKGRPRGPGERGPGGGITRTCPGSR
jgi:transposase